ncbi:molybdopterin molybdotransferase MoeA [Roseiarcaceae bacterium H3SJ34-1]|uniref:molybdopterin molybdotransferase MoeA n=1 Tax=Terripilifer ovatus TaxID=3032367 RepID=UPI003AB99750|nr:molybdopterin molybdotransferase MoeA [Roseiarcaceae bacterium H3SJ34-1]
MAQLSDDCFAFGEPLLSLDEAARLIARQVRSVGASESVALSLADGRVLASDFLGASPLPPFTNSAVDGYAVRHGDLAASGETVLPLAGRLEAGVAAGAMVPASAVRIFTGAMMPAGADTVFMQEDVRVADNHIVLPFGLKRGANVRPMGEDFAAGSVALPKGRRLRPQDVALAAALGATRLDVARRVKVGVFSTGNELVSPGESRSGPQIFDSNRFMLLALLGRLGCDTHDLGVLRDDAAGLAKALVSAAEEHDLIVTSGGVSTGEADHVKAAVEAVGSLVFWRMAIKPGRPVAMGVIAGTPFVGLPGNPVASYVTQAYVVRPLALALMGAEIAPVLPLPVRAAFSYVKKPGRREFLRVSLARAANGVIEAHKFPREGVGLLSSLTQTHGLVELSEPTTHVEPGRMVGFLDYAVLV